MKHEIETMSQKAFDSLPEYSSSIPTGTTIGKKWKRRCESAWFIGEYVKDADPTMVGINWRRIEITNPTPARPGERNESDEHDQKRTGENATKG